MCRDPCPGVQQDQLQPGVKVVVLFILCLREKSSEAVWAELGWHWLCGLGGGGLALQHVVEPGPGTHIESLPALSGGDLSGPRSGIGA